MRCGRPRRMRLRQGQRFPAVKSNESQAAPTGTNVTVRAPALVSSPSAVTAGASSGRSMWISSRSGANAAISGDMLTTAGITVQRDQEMLKGLGYTVRLE